MRGLTTVLLTGRRHELVEHLLIDLLVKGAIVVVALVFLVVGMVFLIWKKVDQPKNNDPATSDEQPRTVDQRSDAWFDP